MTTGPGIEPGSHWWVASALTTAPSLLPQHKFGNYQPIKTSSTHVIYLRDTSQNGGRGPTFFKFIEAVHNCPAVWDVLSLADKHTNKNKQNKTEERADQLGFVRIFLFLHRFMFLLFFSSVSLLYESATTLKKNVHVANYRVCYLTRV